MLLYVQGFSGISMNISCLAIDWNTKAHLVFLCRQLSMLIVSDGLNPYRALNQQQILHILIRYQL